MSTKTGSDRLKKGKCIYCRKDSHPFANPPGNPIGSGQDLRENIIADIKNHPWYGGPGSLQAHHLITSEIMKQSPWKTYCVRFGYDINRKKNGVMLPYFPSLACRLGVPLHRGGHSNTSEDQSSDVYLTDEGVWMNYVYHVEKKIKHIKNKASKGTYCPTKKGFAKFTEALDRASLAILNKLSKFKWKITYDGQNYKKKSGRYMKGCQNIKSVSETFVEWQENGIKYKADAISRKCKQNRVHNKYRVGSLNVPHYSNSPDLQIGK